MEPLILNKLKELAKLRQEHQLELAGEINGVQYINDASSFTIRSTVESINAIQSEQLLIISGDDETTDYSFLRNAELNKVKGVIYLGERSEQLMKVMLSYTHFYATAISIAEAVQVAKAYATQKQVVLFSPACISVDKTLGETFKKLVNETL
jgi:UDP-N-acetylmuramoylalanine--D-glutamate ligase